MLHAMSPGSLRLIDTIQPRIAVTHEGARYEAYARIDGGRVRVTFDSFHEATAPIGSDGAEASAQRALRFLVDSWKAGAETTFVDL